jgi:PAS domain-containing protein
VSQPIAEPLVLAEPGRHWMRDLLARPGTDVAISGLLVALIALADNLTGYELRLAVLYLLPIALLSWARGLGWGLGLCVLATLAWLTVFFSRSPASSSFYVFWEAGAHGVTFVVVATLVASLRRARDHAEERFATVLREMDAAVYAEDTLTEKVVFANRRFRERFADHRPPRGAGATPRVHELHDPQGRRWYLVRERDILWLDGRPARLRILTDITELKEAPEN